MSATLTAESQRLLHEIFGEDLSGVLLTDGQNFNTPRPVGHPSLELEKQEAYYSCARFKPGSHNRKTENVERVMAVVIDDVGSKTCPLDDFLILTEPAPMVETSPGVFHAVFGVEGGCSVEEYRALRASMNTHPVWGRADGNTDPVHWWRLPQGKVTDPKKADRLGFETRLTCGEAQRWCWPLAELHAMLGGPGVGSAGAHTGDAEAWAATSDMDMDVVLAAPGDYAGLPEGLRKRMEADVGVWGLWTGGVSTGDASGSGHVFQLASRMRRRGFSATDFGLVVQVWEKVGLHNVEERQLRRAWVSARKISGGSAQEEFSDEEIEDMGPRAPAAAAIDPVQRQVADSIVSVHGVGLRYNHDSGCWHKFNGWAWEPLPKSVKAGFHLAERWAAANEGSLRPGDFKAVTKANFYNGVEDILRQRLLIRQVDFDRDAWLLGTPGGTVDLRTGALRPALAADFISKACAVTPAEFENCPRFKKFLSEICKGDAGAILFLRQWFGYCLTGDTTEQVFLFLYGPGGNGKSVLMDTMAWVAGTYFVRPVEDLYIKKSMTRHMEAVAMLAGARMAVISEVPSGSQWDEGRLKEHTGGGSITANYMRQNSFSFVPQFKLTALGNHQPTFPGGINPAIRRRFKMMLLDFVPRVPDKTLEKVFQAEGAGILRWAINGLCDSKTGWHKTGLMVPQSVENTTDEYVADQDIFAAWLGGRVEKRRGALTSVEAIFRDWTEYRNAHDSTVEVYSTIKSFVIEMDRRGYVRKRTEAVRGFADIILKSKAKEAFDEE